MYSTCLPLLTPFPFPLPQSTSYKDKFRQSVYEIVRNGVGLIILFYHDGRGYGLGHYVINAQSASGGRARDEADTRDFAGAAALLRQHVTGPYVMLYTGVSSKEVYRRHFDDIQDWLWIGDTSDSHGLNLLQRRQELIFSRLDAPGHSVSVSKPFDAAAGVTYLVTGVGSSEAHAKYFASLVPRPSRASYFPIGTPPDAVDPDARIVVFSQGMSPHTQPWIARAHVLFTSVTEANADAKKVGLLKDLVARGGTVVTFPEEDEYTVLMRIVGPFFGFVAAARYIDPAASVPSSVALKRMAGDLPPLAFTRTAMETRRLAVLVPHAMVPYTQNLGYKWIEGLYFSPPFVTDYLSWIHGSFQAISGSAQPTPHILVTCAGSYDEPISTVLELLGDRHPVWIIRTEHTAVLEVEVMLNYWVLGIMNRMRVNQKEWPGKSTQGMLYNSVTNK